MKKLFLMFVAVLFATFVFAQTQTKPADQKQQPVAKPADNTAKPAVKPEDQPKKTIIKLEDLPKVSQDYLAKDMKDYKIDKVYKIEAKGVISYSAYLMKGSERHKVNFDKDGMAIKKKEVKKEAPATPTTPPTKPADKKTEPAKK